MYDLQSGDPLYKNKQGDAKRIHRGPRVTLVGIDNGIRDFLRIYAVV